MIAGRSRTRPWVGTPGVATQGSRSALDRAMDRVADGELEAFDEVFVALSPRIHAFLTRMSGSSDIARELTESVFARLFVARGAFGRGHAVVAWAYAIAREACLRDPRVAGGAELETVAPPSPGGSSCSAQHDLQSLAARALVALPVHDREAFVLSRFEGLSVLEIAHVVGASETTIRQRAARAHEVLRAALANHATLKA